MTLAVLSEDARLLALCKRLGKQLDLDWVDEAHADITVVEADPSGERILAAAQRGTALVVTNLTSQSCDSTLFANANVIPVPAPVEEVALRSALRVAMHLGAAPRKSRGSSLQNLLQVVSELSAEGAVAGRTVAMAVHDSRTLLSGALGYCRQVLRHADYEQVQSLEHLEDCLQRLDRLSTDLLELALDRSGNLETNPRPADLPATIKRSIVPLIPAAADKGILVRLKIEPPAGEIRFQPDQMERVLANLVENACKFAPQGGTINLVARPVFDPEIADCAPNFRTSTPLPNAYRIDVGDSGPGVPADQLAHIFDERFIGNQTSGRRGFGLGLAIAQAIVRAHDGRIWAESDGCGLTVSVVLRMRRGKKSRRMPGRASVVRSAESTAQLAS
ncbi:MAG: HAMP domain-containing histidine kinase [Bryobacterales bacterium]|nr:HAMP domain-containing histidine kinase [Bryobacterales bacterium]